MALRILINTLNPSSPTHSNVNKINEKVNVYVKSALAVCAGDIYVIPAGTCTAVARADCNVFIGGLKAVTGVLAPTDANLSCGVITEDPTANVFVNHEEI